METIETYLHKLYRVQPDRLHVSRDFAFLQTDAGVAGRCSRSSVATAIDIASLAPNAEISVYPWKEPVDEVLTIDRARAFLRGAPPKGAIRASRMSALAQGGH